MSEELAVRSEAEEALIAAQQAEVDDSGVSFRVPILKVGQPLTKEVQNGDAEVGEFINTLTGDGLGDKVTFIVAYYQKGRFGSDKATNRAYTAFDTAIPKAWADFVGEEWVGTPFDEFPDAEERFKARVNAKEIEWGHGPKVSTTHNYTGLVVLPQEEDEEGEPQYSPVRLSLKRTDMPAVQKFTQVQKALLRGKPWYEIVFNLNVYSKSFTKGPAYLVDPKPGRKTTTLEREDALSLAFNVQAGRVEAQESAEATVAPPSKAEGALDV